MNVNEKELENIIRNVVQQTLSQGQSNTSPSKLTTTSYSATSQNGVFDRMTDAIEAAHRTFLKMSADYDMANRQRFIDGIKTWTLEEKNTLAQMCVDETGLGNFRDKVLKHELAAICSGTEDLKTAANSGDTGLVIEEMAPFGVIGATTPSTNPSETVICNTMNMIASGNTVVFNVHPASKNVCNYVVQNINKIVVSLGGPENIITMVKEPSMESLNEMATSPKINLLVGTGGPGLVRALLQSGKKAIGAGAGNPPVVVDETAVISKAAKDIVFGNSFDNNVVCILEKEVFVVDSVANELIREMQNAGAFLMNADQIRKLEELVLERDGSGYKLNRNWIGKDPHKYLDALNISYSTKPRNIIAETNFEHPFVQKELLMPILPIVRVRNVDEAIDFAVQAEHGNRHTAVMHSQNIMNLTKFARAINTTIFVKNAPSLAGLGVNSEGTPGYTIAGPTGEGITTSKTFTRKRYCVLVDGFRIV